MSRFGEPKPVERIKVLPQKTIKKVASKQKSRLYQADGMFLCADTATNLLLKTLKTMRKERYFAK